ncbi:amino acid adenylation domain protein [Pedosphaera parvula Ellin514]|uniref:Amino acid adenylation domain protein n=1 Tax=Pedosphaera parvula (strain Ellin514) TaxID=320771 RepID=B9XGC7_PEDPL|nr:non-ribosomal peptide synthetase [Pedosphaera parvula]EEF60978.1 amino acid adenylation domain protein [Pedosphaera parvula Ellin514]
MLLENELASGQPEASTQKPTLLERRLQGVGKGNARASSIPRRLKPNHIDLAFAQQRLWFLDQLTPESPLYNFPTAFRLAGNLDVLALQRSLDAIVARHEALRTRFVSVEGTPVQVISDISAVDLPLVDLTKTLPSLREAEAQRLMIVEARRPFNLSQDTMMRALLIKLDSAGHILVVTIHHIATDAWSMGIFFRELSTLYAANCSGTSADLPELKIQYADYAVWQREWLTGDVLAKQAGYWKNRLAGAKDFLELPTDRPRPLVQSFRGGTQSYIIRPELVEGLKQLGRKSGATLFMTLLAAFKTLLYRYSGQEDILVGSPIAGRSRVETEQSIGFFVNTLVLRTDVSGNPTFKELLGRVKDVALGAFAHQDMPFDRLVEELHPERNSSYAPFVQTMFVFQNSPSESLRLPQLNVIPLEIRGETSKFDLSLFIEEREHGLTASFEYSVSLFDDSSITRMWGHFQTLLEEIIHNPEQRISKLRLLTNLERQQLLNDWTNTTTDYPANKCIQDLFEEQVRLTPHAVALKFELQHLTYAELNERSNKLAHHLASAGVRTGSIVGVLMDRSLELIIGLMGILKAGGAYAALDPSSPMERLELMLEDLNSPVVLTRSTTAALLPKSSSSEKTIRPRLICLDEDWPAIEKESGENPVCETNPESIAYICFTSGSTGRPKGVCIPHRGVVRLVRNTEYITLGPEDRMAQCATVSFDAATFEVWGGLLNGGQVHIFSRESMLTPQRFAAELEAFRITTLFLTTALFNQLVAEVPRGFAALKNVLFGGEAVDPGAVRKVLQTGRPRRLLHVYGPTECTTFATWKLVESVEEGALTVPIGRPISNTTAYILDGEREPVPVGVTGEIYLGGDGLARDYLLSPALTAERFVHNPFGKVAGGRLYRTGDLGRYLASGEIEFIGRVDHQVKVRGFRIEPGEIEAVLARHPGVQQCVVNAHQGRDGSKQLTAYFVPHSQPGPGSTELRRHLREKLPEYMVPSAFVTMEAIPLNQNGKVDRRSLPAPETGRDRSEKKYLGPRDSVEKELIGIWESVLGIQPIGIEDRFFDLGGHSLLAVRLLAQIEKKFNKRLPVSVVFQAPTVSQLAGYVRDEKTPEPSSSIVAIQPRGSKPALFFVHGVGGGMFWGYTNLARSLGLDQPVYALKSRSMDGQQEFKSIEEMAAQYVADIRAFQPKGPYHLGGYCFGGNVAYEMARQLCAQGEKVAMLALLNCAPPNSTYTCVKWTPKIALKFIRNVGYLIVRSLGWGAQQRNEFLRWKAALIRRRMARFFRLTGESAKRINVEDMVDLSAFPKDQKEIWETHIHALIEFFPKPYAGKATLFRSRGHQLFCSYDNQYGWDEFASEVEVHVVPGAHESILEEPHVREVAENIKACLLKMQIPELVSASAASAAKKISTAPVGSSPMCNDTESNYPAEMCIHQLFEEQVKRTPDASAVIFGEQQLTYRELNTSANKLAHHLQSLGVSSDVPVGLCLERSIELVTAILGILKAGGAYVPLDPAYPKERLAMMLDDSRAPVLVTQEKLLITLPDHKCQVVCIDKTLPTAFMEQNPVSTAVPGSLAYVIYTSGSTGKPKGVAMGHRPLVNLIWWQLKSSTMGKGDKTLQFASPSFDVSFQEIFSTWCSGGVLMLIDEEVRHDPPKLLRFIREQKVNRLYLPFIALHQLAESVTEEDLLPESLREVITAGEQLRITGKITTLFEKLTNCTLHNHYGPSESHVVTAYTLPGTPGQWPALPPIGKPIANTQIHLLDDQFQPVVAGEPGELYIGGVCLARGYLHQAHLTSERFIADPTALEQGARLYKTGDLARLLPDGNIEFLGRVDHQVKIRGYRVELSEVENVLGKHPAARECVVSAREDVPGQKRLVGYLVLQPGQNVTVKDLRDFLQSELPDYMVPSAYVILDSLPLTPSGKVNRMALPEPDQGRPELGAEYVAPGNATEERIAAIWSEVLNLKKIGVRDNFFELGGHSLLVAQVVSRIRQTFKVELPLSSLFDAPSIASLAAGIEAGTWNQGGMAAPPIKPTEKKTNAPLSFSQRRLWFIDRLEPGSHAYNVPLAIRLEGTLNVAALEQSLNKIIERHEALRTTISFVDGSLAQVTTPHLKLALAITDLRKLDEADRDAHAKMVIEEDARKPFDLERGPLIRGTLVKLDDVRNELLVVMHHIISDGWSLGLILTELDLFYTAFTSGKTVPAPPELTVQYVDYAVWQNQWMQGEVLEKEVTFWRERLAGAPSAIELPGDHMEDSEPGAKCGLHQVILPGELTDSLSSLSRREGTTPFMVLTAALATTLHKWSQQSDLVIGTVVAGRNQKEIEDVIGCFMNFVPVRIKVAEQKTSSEFLKDVKHAVLEAHAHQDCPFEKIVEAINPERKTAQNPLYNVGLLFQNFPGGAFNAAGLKAEMMQVDLQAALLDLRFIAEETAGGFAIACEYKMPLFEPATIQHLLNYFCKNLETLTREPQRKIAEIEKSQDLTAQIKAAKARQNRQTICIAATFTAEPLEEGLKYWMKELGIPAAVEFAGYNQVFQELLNPGSSLALNQNGLNAILIRLEDWARFEGVEESSSSSGDQRVERSVDELTMALKAASARHATPYLVCLCPGSANIAAQPERAEFYRQMETRLAGELHRIPGVHLTTFEEIAKLYPVEEYNDPQAEELGHIPYTTSFFTALSTIIARRFHALKRAAYKVIVLDCDNTLWSGVAGEDGPDGIQLGEARFALQEFMRKQGEAGMLLCLCSKNEQEDVAAVFEQRREMPLKREHFTASRINWLPKSENIRSLADELKLGLESFIFVDDNPVECAEVESHCPEVMTLLLPAESGQIPKFLEHCWVFDHLKLSTEDKHRTAMYRQEKEREQFREQSLGLQDFLAGLELRVEITDLTSNQVTRAAQLTLRTNQFNMTTRRRTESDLQSMWRQGKSGVLTVSVRDRFGDYGLVGLIIHEAAGNAIKVDTFLLSCRVLGRGVEYQMVVRLGRLALAKGLDWVDFHFIPSEKNKPAFNFLETVGARFRQPTNGGYIYRFPAEFAAGIVFTPEVAEKQQPAKASFTAEHVKVKSSTSERRVKFTCCREIALAANDVSQIQQAMAAKSRTRSRDRKTYSAPTTETERMLSKIWEELLRVDKVGIHDNFFELGGHSLLAVRLFAQVEKLTGKKLPLVTLFQNSTVKQLADVLCQNSGVFPFVSCANPQGSKPPLSRSRSRGGRALGICQFSAPSRRGSGRVWNQIQGLERSRGI